jgi:hypothetical protein
LLLAVPVVAPLVIVTRREEPVYTLAKVEPAFDAAGLEVEPHLSVFLEPARDEDFDIMVFDDAEEASWSYNESERLRPKRRRIQPAPRVPDRIHATARQCPRLEQREHQLLDVSQNSTGTPAP